MKIHCDFKFLFYILVFLGLLIAAAVVSEPTPPTDAAVEAAQ